MLSEEQLKTSLRRAKWKIKQSVAETPWRSCVS